MSLNLSAADSYYIVKKGDTLTSILHRKKMKPIYGEHGSLAETLLMNPNIIKSRGNKIFPAMRILLSKESSESVAAVTAIAAPEISKEIIQTPEEVQAPIQEKNMADRVPSDDFKQSFYWEVGPALSWKSLSSKDENISSSSKITALSNANYGLSVTYGMHFQENINVYSRLSLESVKFIEDDSLNLVNKKTLATNFTVGFSYEKKWFLEFAMSDEFFLMSPRASTVEIKKVTLPEVQAIYKNDFYHYKQAALSYSLSGAALLPRNAPGIDSEWGYGVGGAIDAKLRNQSFRIGYDLKQLRALGNTTSSQNIYWKYIWETL